MFQQLNICFTFVHRLEVPAFLRYNEPIIFLRANRSLMYACPFSNARLVLPINNNLEYYHVNDRALLHHFYDVFTNGAEGDRLGVHSPVLSNVIRNL